MKKTVLFAVFSVFTIAIFAQHVGELKKPLTDIRNLLKNKTGEFFKN